MQRAKQQAKFYFQRMIYNNAHRTCEDTLINEQIHKIKLTMYKKKIQ